MVRGRRPVRRITRSIAGASRGASAGLLGSTVWSTTMPSSLSTTWALCLNSIDLPSRPLAIGRTSGSCRLTRRRAQSGVLPPSRCRVCAAICEVAASSWGRSLTARASRPRRRPAGDSGT